MIKHVTISGFKSIEHMQLELKPLNVLIGANGAGKSNLISFFEMLRWVGNGSLQTFVAEQGGADKLLYWGAKRTQQINAAIEWEHDDGSLLRYEARWRYAHGDTLFFENERFLLRELQHLPWTEVDLGGGYRETRLLDEPSKPGSGNLLELLGGCRTYHFHDTSATAGIRQNQYISDIVKLRRDAGNLAAVLYRLQAAGGVAYKRLIATIRQVVPWLHDFELTPLEENEQLTSLQWKGTDPDYVFTAHQLPDGALRAIALITLLLEAEKLGGRTVIIDEPELGLHPYALNAVSGLLKAAAHHCQVIVATQSASLVDDFEPEDVVVVDRDEQAPMFKRLDADRLEEWLEGYSLGELWRKNVLGGGPA